MLGAVLPGATHRAARLTARTANQRDAALCKPDGGAYVYSSTKEGIMAKKSDRSLEAPFEKRTIGFLDWFEVHDRDRLEAVLDKLGDVERTGGAEWEWRETVDGHCRVVAELGFEGEMFIVLATREADAHRCSSRIQAVARTAVERRIRGERFEIRFPDGSVEPGCSGVFI